LASEIYGLWGGIWTWLNNNIVHGIKLKNIRIKKKTLQKGDPKGGKAGGKNHYGVGGKKPRDFSKHWGKCWSGGGR